MHSSSLAPLLILVVVLVLSGVAKLRAPRTVEASFRDLRVPAVLSRPWMQKAFPWGEIALAVLLLVLPRPLAAVGGVLAVVLFAAYWFLIWRGLGFEEPVSCGCFGEASSEPITRRTLWRNSVLLAVPLWWLVATFRTSGPHLLSHTGPGSWLWVLGLAAAAATVWLAMPASGTAAPAAGPEVPEVPVDEEGEYERRPIPGMMLRDAEDQLISLQLFASQRARLVVLVSPGCGPCMQVLDQAAAWKEKLGPVSLNLMTQGTQEALESATDRSLWPDHLYDIGRFAGPMLGLNGTPSAVLLGADGLIAGGPVVGFPEIELFVQDIAEQVAGVELPADPREAETVETVEGEVVDRERPAE